MQFFNKKFLKKLETLKLMSRKVVSGSMKGEHKSSLRGSATEFSDYRNYVPGDDLRYVDWNVYGRAERLFLKLFREEVDLTVKILIDSSKSMSFGSPQKIDYAKKLAAALAYITLSNLDRVGVSHFSSDGFESTATFRGKQQIFNIFNFIENIECLGKTRINDSLKKYSYTITKPCLVVVLSDFLDPNGYETGLKFLKYKKNDVIIMQVLDMQELKPDILGDVQLIDAETNLKKELSLDNALLGIYMEKMDEYNLNLKKFCLKHGIDYLLAETAMPFDRLILNYLERRKELVS